MTSGTELELATETFESGSLREREVGAELERELEEESKRLEEQELGRCFLCGLDRRDALARVTGGEVRVVATEVTLVSESEDPNSSLLVGFL